MPDKITRVRRIDEGSGGFTNFFEEENPFNGNPNKGFSKMLDDTKIDLPSMDIDVKFDRDVIEEGFGSFNNLFGERKKRR